MAQPSLRRRVRSSSFLLEFYFHLLVVVAVVLFAENKKKKKKTAAPPQTEPPSIGLTQYFKPDAFPTGAIQDYTQDWNLHRTTSEECRAKEREGLASEESEFNYNSIRRAAEVHRTTRAYAQKHIQPGMKMTDIANMIEESNRLLVEFDAEDPKARGIGFPTGLSLNHCAAHYTPNVCLLLSLDGMEPADFCASSLETKKVWPQLPSHDEPG